MINGCLRAAAKATIRANGSLNILALTLAACLLPQPSYPGRFQLGRDRADDIEKRNNGVNERRVNSTDHTVRRLRGSLYTKRRKTTPITMSCTARGPRAPMADIREPKCNRSKHL